jgi:hypothetical protein
MKKKTKVINRDFLEQLSIEELAEMVSVAEAKEAKMSRTGKYEPNKVQARVHASDAFIRVLLSGNGAGKTTGCIWEGIWTSTGTHPYRESSRIPNTTIIILDDGSKADTIYVNELRKRKWYDMSKLKLDKHGRSYTQEITFPNGSNWIFMTHEMAEDKFESIQCAAIIFDEPPPRYIYVALMRGQREKDMKPWIMFAGTPRGRNAPWMYRELYRPWKLHQDPDIECFTGSTDDNLMNLDPDTIKRWEKRWSKEELETRRHGKFEFLSGRIFNEFFRDHHVEKDFAWPFSWPVVLCMDPHLRKDHTAVLLGIDPDKEVHVILELETSLAGRKAAEFFIRACERFPVKWGICDNFGSMPGTGGEDRKSFIEIFNEVAKRLQSRVRIRPTTKAEKGDDEWIEDMRDWLRLEPDNAGNPRPKFHVFESCEKTIDNFESYVWDEHRGINDIQGKDHREPKEKPLGTDCDFLMCVKYGIATKPDKWGVDKIYSRAAVKAAGKAREYESHGSWMKD